MDVGERDPLRSYLISKLERTRKGVRSLIPCLPSSSSDAFGQDITQRMMLATWLVEFYLSKCNELEDSAASEIVSNDVDNLRAHRTIVEDDLRQFLDTYKVGEFRYRLAKSILIVRTERFGSIYNI